MSQQLQCDRFNIGSDSVKKAWRATRSGLLGLTAFFASTGIHFGQTTPHFPGYCPAASGVAVCIDAPSDLEVPAGGSKVITASVGGTKEKAVDWIVKCSGSACGKMTDDVYTAPIVRPNPPVVTLTAISKADPTARASITIHLVPASQVQVSASIQPPRLISSFQPSLSAEQVKQIAGDKILKTGSVIVGIVVGEDGTVRSATVLESFSRDLDAKAIEAAKQWKFEPATRNGVPVAAELEVKVDFHLNK